MKRQANDSTQKQMQNGQDNAQSQPSEKKLGLSKVVYGLGTSARDGLITIVVGTAALFPVFYFGQDKFKTIEKMAKWPERVKATWHKSLGENASKTSSALAVSAGLAFLASHVTNLPGLVIGAKKVQDAENKFDDEVQSNAELAHENMALAGQLKHQAVALADAEKKLEQFAPQPENTARTGNDGFADKLAANAGKSNIDKIAAKRAADQGNNVIGA